MQEIEDMWLTLQHVMGVVVMVSGDNDYIFWHLSKKAW
jgi:hypothetical protein